jgi:hypothetical protein
MCVDSITHQAGLERDLAWTSTFVGGITTSRMSHKELDLLFHWLSKISPSTSIERSSLFFFGPNTVKDHRNSERGVCR